MAFPPTFDRAWDETFPPDTQLANLLGQDIRDFKTDIRERLSGISGTLANRPANMDAVFAGMLYFAIDTSQIFRWNGSAWIFVSGNIISVPGQINVSPSITASDDRSISTSLAPTTIYTPSSSGLYLVPIYMVVSASNSVGSFQVTYSVNYGDSVLGASFYTAFFTAPNSLGARMIFTVGGVQANSVPNCLVFNLGGATNFTVNVLVSFSGGAAATFRMIHRFLYLG